MLHNQLAVAAATANVASGALPGTLPVWDDLLLRLEREGVSISDITGCDASVFADLTCDLGFTALQRARLQTEWRERAIGSNSTPLPLDSPEVSQARQMLPGFLNVVAAELIVCPARSARAMEFASKIHSQIDLLWYRPDLTAGHHPTPTLPQPATPLSVESILHISRDCAAAARTGSCSVRPSASPHHLHFAKDPFDIPSGGLPAGAASQIPPFHLLLCEVALGSTRACLAGDPQLMWRGGGGGGASTQHHSLMAESGGGLRYSVASEVQAVPKVLLTVQWCGVGAVPPGDPPRSPAVAATPNAYHHPALPAPGSASEDYGGCASASLIHASHTTHASRVLGAMHPTATSPAQAVPVPLLVPPPPACGGAAPQLHHGPPSPPPRLMSPSPVAGGAAASPPLHPVVVSGGVMPSSSTGVVVMGSSQHPPAPSPGFPSAGSAASVATSHVRAAQTREHTQRLLEETNRLMNELGKPLLYRPTLPPMGPRAQEQALTFLREAREAEGGASPSSPHAEERFFTGGNGSNPTGGVARPISAVLGAGDGGGGGAGDNQANLRRIPVNLPSATVAGSSTAEESGGVTSADTHPEDLNLEGTRQSRASVAVGGHTDNPQGKPERAQAEPGRSSTPPEGFPHGIEGEEVVVAGGGSPEEEAPKQQLPAALRSAPAGGGAGMAWPSNAAGQSVRRTLPAPHVGGGGGGGNAAPGAEEEEEKGAAAAHANPPQQRGGDEASAEGSPDDAAPQPRGGDPPQPMGSSSQLSRGSVATAAAGAPPSAGSGSSSSVTTSGSAGPPPPVGVCSGGAPPPPTTPCQQGVGVGGVGYRGGNPLLSQPPVPAQTPTTNVDGGPGLLSELMREDFVLFRDVDMEEVGKRGSVKEEFREAAAELRDVIENPREEVSQRCTGLPAALTGGGPLRDTPRLNPAFLRHEARVDAEEKAIQEAREPAAAKTEEEWEVKVREALERVSNLDALSRGHKGGKSSVSDRAEVLRAKYGGGGGSGGGDSQQQGGVPQASAGSRPPIRTPASMGKTFCVGREEPVSSHPGPSTKTHSISQEAVALSQRLVNSVVRQAGARGVGQSGSAPYIESSKVSPPRGVSPQRSRAEGGGGASLDAVPGEPLCDTLARIEAVCKTDFDAITSKLEGLKGKMEATRQSWSTASPVQLSNDAWIGVDLPGGLWGPALRNLSADYKGVLDTRSHGKMRRN